LFLLHEPSDHTIHSWQADDVGVFTPPKSWSFASRVRGFEGSTWCRLNRLVRSIF
jgi:hypothetical protein